MAKRRVPPLHKLLAQQVPERDPDIPVGTMPTAHHYYAAEPPNGPRAPERIATMVKVNFAAVADSFQPRDKGEYEGTLISHKINEASASSGQPTITLEWSEDDSPNRKMFKTYSLQPKALWSLKRDLIRIGKADPTFIERLNDEDADLDELIASLYGFSNTLVYGEPRTGKDKEGNERQFDNFLEVKDPDKL